VLALRLDVGTAACYHCFFDVVIDTTTSTTTSVNDNGSSSSSSSDMLYLRLVQHTLPPAIPLAAILHRHLGGVTAIGRLTDQRWKTTELLQKLRATANQLYHACHCWQVRKETYQYLERLAAKTKIVASPTLSKKKRRSPPSRNSSSSEVPVVQREVEPPLVASPQTYSVDHLECVGCNDTYKTIRFHLHHRLSGIAEAVEVTLQYATDLCRPRAHQPATVTIKIPTAATSAADVLPRGRNRTATNNTAEVVSDAEDNDEEDIHDEFIENAILSFRRLPIREAMQQVTDAMAEW
jgi:Cenp-O kinetochore centromere component